MTDMKISTCVPLPGPGVVARYGDLVAVTDSQGDGPDPLLGTLEEGTARDGAALVLAVARAVLAFPAQFSGACAGVTAGGEVAVLVYGGATAAIAVDGAPEVMLTASGSILPVSQTFAGNTITVRLLTGGSVTPDPRLRLDGGVVYGCGLVLRASSDVDAPGPGPLSSDTTQSSDTRMPDSPVPGRQPQLHQPDPAAEFEYVSFLSPAGEPVQPGHGPHGRPVEVDTPSAETAGTDPYAADPALVDGVLCARNHFNDPNVQYCRQCGISMVQLTQRIQKGPRPPLGVLLLDDGTGFTLDMDYVVGREPVLDGDVAAGRARPLRIPDPGGTVSRLHLRISLIGWQVEVRDLNSSNGSVLTLPNGAEHRLPSGDAVIIEPGTKISVGHRSIQYQSYRAG